MFTKREKVDVNKPWAAEDVQKSWKREAALDGDIEARRSRYFCGKDYVNESVFEPWDIQVPRAIDLNKYTIIEQIREEARERRLSELLEERKMGFVAQVREVVHTLTEPDGEFESCRPHLNMINDEQIIAALPITRYNVIRVSKYVLGEITEEIKMSEFAILFARFYAELPKDTNGLVIPYPNANQRASLLHHENRTFEQAIATFSDMVEVIRGVYTRCRRTLTYNQCYRVLRQSSWRVEAAVASYFDFETAYRQMKKEICERCHRNDYDEIDFEFAMSILRRTNCLVEEAVNYYASEYVKRLGLVSKFKIDMAGYGITKLPSDRGIYYHLGDNFWDFCVARDRWNLDVILDFDARHEETKRQSAEKRERRANEKALRATKKLQSLQTSAMDKSDAEEENGDSAEVGDDNEENNISKKSSKNAKNSQKAPKKNKNVGEKEKEKEKDAIKEESVQLSALSESESDSDADDEVLGLDMMNKGGSDDTSSAQLMIKQERANRALRKLFYEDGVNRDKPVLPRDRPVEADTEINKIASLYFGNILTLEVDMITIPVTEDFKLNTLLKSAFTAAGPKLPLEFNSLSKNHWFPGQAKVCRGYNLPAKYVCFVVVPNTHKPDAMKAAGRAALDEFKKLKLKTYAALPLGNASEGFPTYSAMHFQAVATRQWMDITTNRRACDRVIFCVDNKKDFEGFSRVLPLYFCGPQFDTTIMSDRYAERRKEIEVIGITEEYKRELENLSPSDVVIEEEDNLGGRTSTYVIEEDENEHKAGCVGLTLNFLKYVF